MSTTLVDFVPTQKFVGGQPLEDAIQKAEVLIEALSYIRQFRDRITVIKLGGSVMETPESLTSLLQDVVFMETVGMRPVLVHGGGAAITRGMSEAGLQPRWVQGRRYTDDATLGIVEQVLAYDINNDIVNRIEALGGRAAPLNFRTTNVLFGEQIQLPGEGGEMLDLGHVGQVTRIDRRSVENLCYAGIVPVIPSMCINSAGQKLNVNADTAATAVAQNVGAEKLIFLSDVNGVRRDKSNPDSLINSLTSHEALELIRTGVIDSGMIPKIQACLDTLGSGVKKTHIVDGRLKHSLLLEIYTKKGVGTEIIQT